MNSSAPIPFLFDFKLIEKITFALNVFESFLISYSESRRENIYSYPRNMKRLLCKDFVETTKSLSPFILVSSIS